MDPRMTADPYWQSAQKLSAILKDSIAIAPDREDAIRKIPPTQMFEALQEMCSILSFMAEDKVLYERIEEARRDGPKIIAEYLAHTGVSIDELFRRFMQFEQAVHMEAKINYDLGVLMMAAVQSKGSLIKKAFLDGSLIDVDQIRANVRSVRNEVCGVAKDFGDEMGRTNGFIWGRLLTAAGVEVSVNSAVAAGFFAVSPTPPALPLSVGSFSSKITGGIFAMLPSGWLK